MFPRNSRLANFLREQLGKPRRYAVGAFLAFMVFLSIATISLPTIASAAKLTTPHSFTVTKDDYSSCSYMVSWADIDPDYEYKVRVNGGNPFDRQHYNNYRMVFTSGAYSFGTYLVEVQSYDIGGSAGEPSDWGYIQFSVDASCGLSILDEGTKPADPPDEENPNPATPPPTPKNLIMIGYNSGLVQMQWDDVPQAYGYNVYVDGVLYNTAGPLVDEHVIITGLTDGQEYDITVTAVDAEGNESPQSPPTKVVPSGIGGGDPTDPEDPPPADGCAVCDKISELLACPGWNEIIAQLDAIIPDAPDWDNVADKIGAATVRHLENYLGPVPAPPTQAEIDGNTTLPTLDISTEAANLVPQMPAGYEQPIPFDIENGPQIEIVDESEPFIINDPLHNVPHDDYGVPVLPNDERNDSNGIKSPESPIPVYVGSQMPTPTPPIGEGDPIPDDPTPKPDYTGGVIPIPKPYGGQ